MVNNSGLSNATFAPKKYIRQEKPSYVPENGLWMAPFDKFEIKNDIRVQAMALLELIHIRKNTSINFITRGVVLKPACTITRR